MASLNKAMIMGRLGQDPELRYTPNQNAVTTLNIATSEFRTGKDGQRQESTEWHRIVVWSRQAENCHKYLKKGSMVYVEGRIQTRSWDDPNGQKKYSTEIVAQNVQFLPTTNGTGRPTKEDTGMGSYPDQFGMGGSNTSSVPASSNPMEQLGGFPPASNSQSSTATSPAAPNFDDIPF